DRLAEQGAGSADLVIEDQDRDSLVATVGYQLAYRMGSWTPYLRLSLDSEMEDDPRDVTAYPRNLGSASSYRTSIEAPDGDVGRGEVGLSGSIGEQFAVHLAYRDTFSGGDVDGGQFVAQFEYRFGGGR
ncbi:MAG TPA: autotransporter outer membrane beta-barrel domain-containing protein, partial [Gammaproteobacteria bacterium]